MLKEALRNMTSRPLPNDIAGCTRGDCPMRSSCWRYEGAKLRQGDALASPSVRVVMALFKPENCEGYWRIGDE